MRMEFAFLGFSLVSSKSPFKSICRSCVLNIAYRRGCLCDLKMRIDLFISGFDANRLLCYRVSSAIGGRVLSSSDLTPLAPRPASRQHMESNRGVSPVQSHTTQYTMDA